MLRQQLEVAAKQTSLAEEAACEAQQQAAKLAKELDLRVQQVSCCLRYLSSVSAVVISYHDPMGTNGPWQ